MRVQTAVREAGKRGNKGPTLNIPAVLPTQTHLKMHVCADGSAQGGDEAVRQPAGAPRAEFILSGVQNP